MSQEGPGETVVAALRQESENPERVWNASMATTTALEVATLANTARASQVRFTCQVAAFPLIVLF